MTYEMQRAYAEVYEVLHCMPQEYSAKIPKKIIEMLNAEKLKGYQVELKQDNLVDATKLTKMTMTILAIFQYQYWCQNKEMKQELYHIYSKNEENYQKELKEKYNSDELFKKQKKMKTEEKLSIVQYKESVFTKLYTFVKNIFNKDKSN